MKIASPVLILGARSDIGRALARAYAARGHDIILAARGDIEADRRDLELRSAVKVRAVPFDVTDGAADQFFAELAEVPGTVVMVAGLLGDQAESVADDQAASIVMETNYRGPARYLLAAARVMQADSDACIIGISSVAGDRGRSSNYVYGSAKAGFSEFLSGLRGDLARRKIHVMTVKPGFVATRMTEGMDLPPLLTAQPQAVADYIVRAHSRRRNVVYAKPIWRPIMSIIKIVPERIFKRMKF